MKGSKLSMREERVRRILEGAFELFLKFGYNGTSVDAIVAAVGVSKPTIYKYFPNKEQLFQAIVSGVVDRILVPTQGAPRPTASTAAALRQFAKNYADVIFSARALALHRLVIGEAERFPELGARYYEHGYLSATEGTARYLQHFADRGDLTFNNSANAAHDFWALVLSRAHNQLLLEPDRPLPSSKLRLLINNGLRVFLAAYSPASQMQLPERRVTRPVQRR